MRKYALDFIKLIGYAVFGLLSIPFIPVIFLGWFGKLLLDGYFE